MSQARAVKIKHLHAQSSVGAGARSRIEEEHDSLCDSSTNCVSQVGQVLQRDFTAAFFCEPRAQLMVGVRRLELHAAADSALRASAQASTGTACRPTASGHQVERKEEEEHQEMHPEGQHRDISAKDKAQHKAADGNGTACRAARGQQRGQEQRKPKIVVRSLHVCASCRCQHADLRVGLEGGDEAWGKGRDRARMA